MLGQTAATEDGRSSGDVTRTASDGHASTGNPKATRFPLLPRRVSCREPNTRPSLSRRSRGTVVWRVFHCAVRVAFLKARSRFSFVLFCLLVLQRMSLGLPTQHPQAGNRLVDPLGSDIVGVVGVVRLQVSEVFSASESVEGGVSVASGSAPLSGVVCGAVCGDIGALFWKRMEAVVVRFADAVCCHSGWRRC